MSIPDFPDLHEILSGIRLSPKPAVDQGVAIQLPVIPGFDEAGRPGQDKPLWLHYPAETKITFRVLTERINKELNKARHTRHHEFALFVLALAALTPPAHGSIISRVNEIIERVCDADVVLYYILFAGFPEIYKFEIPPFQLGPLRAEKLRYNSEKAGSDYYSRYRENLPKAWAVEREPLKVRVLDFPLIQEAIFGGPLGAASRMPSSMQAWNSILQGYFSLQNRALFDKFWVELIEAQSPLLALGAPFFDPRPLSTLVVNTTVAIFQNLGRDRGGFVMPMQAGSSILFDFAGVHERAPNALKELKEEYGFRRFDDSPLHQSIKLFANFVARARRHEIDGRLNEALLHTVIALELIFGERQTIQKSVSERVSLITFRKFGRSFKEQCNWINGIYEMRSQYVHTGAEITDETCLDQLRSLCEQVFRCLMRLQASHLSKNSRGQDALIEWLRNIDYLAKGIIAGRPPNENQLAEAFIL